jgi:hypothetical protein
MDSITLWKKILVQVMSLLCVNLPLRQGWLCNMIKQREGRLGWLVWNDSPRKWLVVWYCSVNDGWLCLIFVKVANVEIVQNWASRHGVVILRAVYEDDGEGTAFLLVQESLADRTLVFKQLSITSRKSLNNLINILLDS